MRTVLTGVMLASLLMAASLPQAFGGNAPLFEASYVGLQVGRNAAAMTLLGRDRPSPYVVGGYGQGVSRPNVNERFPEAVSNSARVLFAGGGIQVPLRERINIFGDVRMTFGAEGNDGIIAFVPVRVGVAWRF